MRKGATRGGFGWIGRLGAFEPRALETDKKHIFAKKRMPLHPKPHISADE
jgi:hypothetical protein